VKYIVSVNGRRTTIELGTGEVELGGRTIPVSLADVEGTPVRLVRVGDKVHRVIVRNRAGRGCYTLWLDGFTYEIEALDERTRTIRDLTAAQSGPAGPAPLVAPMPGLIVRVMAEPGDVVAPGQGLVVMEAMKMENELRAAGSGRVRAVHAKPGEAVDKGALLVELEAE
jgi:Acetyl/propionyl-CoA carboxylase, alpha subunit